jgi:hypothetical protein
MDCLEVVLREQVQLFRILRKLLPFNNVHDDKQAIINLYIALYGILECFLITSFLKKRICQIEKRYSDIFLDPALKL